MSARIRRIVTIFLAGPLLLVGLAACGGDDGASSDGPTVSLSPEGDAGRQLAADSGCASCHGGDGQGGVGPAWVGLAGSTVELSDGSTVTADTDYLLRAITDPGADVVDGSAVEMPENDLTDEEAAQIVAYIEELAG